MEVRNNDRLRLDPLSLSVHNDLRISTTLRNYRLLQIRVNPQFSHMLLPIIPVRAVIRRATNVQPRHDKFLFEVVEGGGFVLLFGEGNAATVGLFLKLDLRHVFDHRAD